MFGENGYSNNFVIICIMFVRINQENTFFLAPAPPISLQGAVFRCLFGRAPYKESQEVVESCQMRP
jgi:hypothetical protein